MSSTQPPQSAGFGRTAQDLFVTGFGFVTSSLTALILALIENKLDFSLYSLMWLFVVPIGALLSGFGGASGYYLGAKLFHHRPTRLLLFNMVSIAISTYFLVNWLNYSLMEIDGHSVSEMIPFSRYLDIMLSHQSMEFRVRGAKLGESGELGDFGYVIAGLQILGFAVGGLCVYLYLQAEPYCDACAKYLKRVSTTTRYTENKEQLTGLYASLLTHLEQGEAAAASQLITNFGNPKHGKDMNLNAELSLWKCRTCPQEFFDAVVNKWDGKDWKAVSELHIRDYMPRTQN